MFENYNLKKRLNSMIKLDFRRLFTSTFFYIIVASCFVAPILILVMTKMMEGSPMTDQNGNPILDANGNIVLMEGFKNVWQMLGSVSNSSSGMSMDLVSMCNINMMYFALAVLICMFIFQEFKSGYVKNLFTVRSNKADYVISKTLIGFVGGVIMIFCFFVGSLLGGAIASISFNMEGFNIYNIVMCLLSKFGLVLVFDGIFVLMSVVAKDKLWLSLLVGLGASMLLFMMIPLISPLDATIINVLLSLVGGLIFAFSLGVISNTVLRKTSLI